LRHNTAVADYCTYLPIILAAVLLALIQGVKDLEGSNTPAFLKKPILNYAPLLLLLLGGTTFLARQFGPVARFLGDPPTIITDSQIKPISTVPTSTTSPPPQPTQINSGSIDTDGHILWRTNQLFVVGLLNTDVGLAASGMIFQGRSLVETGIKEAYVVSGMTGHRQQLLASVANRGDYPVDKVDIPNSAPVQLDLYFSPQIPIKNVMDQWGKFKVTIVYSDGTKQKREFGEALVREKLQEQAPEYFGPRERR